MKKCVKNSFIYIKLNIALANAINFAGLFDCYTDQKLLEITENIGTHFYHVSTKKPLLFFEPLKGKKLFILLLFCVTYLHSFCLFVPPSQTILQSELIRFFTILFLNIAFILKSLMLFLLFEFNCNLNISSHFCLFAQY